MHEGAGRFEKLRGENIYANIVEKGNMVPCGDKKSKKLTTRRATTAYETTESFLPQDDNPPLTNFNEFDNVGRFWKTFSEMFWGVVSVCFW